MIFFTNYIILIFRQLIKYFGVKMADFISNLIQNDLLATIIMSCVPLIELKGAIVFARDIGYGFLSALGLSYLGSTIVFIPIFFLLKPLLKLLKKVKWLELSNMPAIFGGIRF